jgi:hypothetical protein
LVQPVSRSFEARQAQAFLDRIDAERDRELARLHEAARAGSAAIRRQARAAVKAFHRRVAVEARERFAADHQRKLARAAAEFRRRRWAALRTLEQAAQRVLEEEFLSRWQTPDQRLAWCRHFIDSAASLGFGAASEIRVGAAEAAFEVILEPLAAALDPATVAVDPGAEPGIEIRDGARYLDGRLASYMAPALDAMARDYAAWVHNPGFGDGERT